MATPKTKSVRLSKAEINKVNEIAKQRTKVKITGSASSKPQVSASMAKSQPKTTSKSKLTGGLAKVLKPIKPAPMTPQDAAMFKLLQKKYPNLYPKKSSPLNK